MSLLVSVKGEQYEPTPEDQQEFYDWLENTYAGGEFVATCIDNDTTTEITCKGCGKVENVNIKPKCKKELINKFNKEINHDEDCECKECNTCHHCSKELGIGFNDCPSCNNGEVTIDNWEEAQAYLDKLYEAKPMTKEIAVEIGQLEIEIERLCE